MVHCVLTNYVAARQDGRGDGPHALKAGITPALPTEIANQATLRFVGGSGAQTRQ
jgi:hypothetical protein